MEEKSECSLSESIRLSSPAQACTGTQLRSPSPDTRAAAIDESFSSQGEHLVASAATEHLSTASRDVFVNPIVEGIQQQVQLQGRSTQRQALVQGQRGERSRSVNCTAQHRTEAHRNQHAANMACEQQACASDALLVEVREGSLQHERSPQAISRRKACQRGSLVLTALTENGQHSGLEEARLSSSCDDSSSEVAASPEFPRSRHSAAGTEGPGQMESQENDRARIAVGGVGQTGGVRPDTPGEGRMHACNPNSTVDAVRSICWQLESFMEQYVATQLHDPHSCQPSERTSDRECLDSPPNVTPVVQRALQEDGNGAGAAAEEPTSTPNAPDAHKFVASKGVHLSISSEPAHRCDQADGVGIGSATMAADDKARQHEGLHAVLHISQGNAEISVFDSKNDTLSTVLVNDTRGRPDRDQVCAEDSQAAVYEDHHAGERSDSGNTSESCERNPRMRFGPRPTSGQHSVLLYTFQDYDWCS